MPGTLDKPRAFVDSPAPGTTDPLTPRQRLDRHPNPRKTRRVSTGPLSDLRVLEITHNLAGPLTAMHLADLGAEVIKIERPAGDEWREHEGVKGHPGRSRHFLQVNRNKRAACIDLSTAEGHEIAGRLVERTDVLITNLRVGVHDRLGVDWERCERLNPGLVYCQLTAFGGSGPLAGRRGYDMVVEARAGFLVDGLRPGDPPRSSPVPINDTALPLLAGLSILAALRERDRSGLGQRIDLSLLQSAVALNAHSLVRLDDGQESEVRFSRAFYRTYATQDGWIAVAAYAEHLARAFCATLGLSTLLDDPRFQTRASRVRNEELLAELFAETIVTRTTSDWEAAFASQGVPAGPVHQRDALFDDPQVRAMGMLSEFHDDELGQITMTSPVTGLSRTPGTIRVAGRHLGADTRDVLAEIGYSEAEINDLESRGVAVSRSG